MTDRSAKMALIGAGPVGLGMAKALLEHKIPYEELEADDDLGGNWYHGVYETVHIISSRKTTEYADYPMPEHYPDFPSRQQMLEYLRDYAEKFGLREHIQFNTKVVMALPLADGKWELELATGEKRVYKGLIVCNGHHWHKRFPNYPGKFEGEFIHSKDYRSPAQVAGKRVLVIGGGNSACDIAAEAARVGKTARMSVRRGYWFLPKTFFGIPSAEMMKPWFPVWAQRLMMRMLVRITVGKYLRDGLLRELSIFAAGARAGEGKRGATVRGLRARGLQESLHHRDVAIALWIRAGGYTRSGPGGADDAGAGPNGAFARTGDERVGGATAYDASCGSTCGTARHSQGQAAPAAALVEGKEAAEEAGSKRQRPAGIPGKASDRSKR